MIILNNIKKKKLRKYILDGTSVELVTIATKICF